jgi:hypothetical protein
MAKINTKNLFIPNESRGKRYRRQVILDDDTTLATKKLFGAL